MNRSGGLIWLIIMGVFFWATNKAKRAAQQRRQQAASQATKASGSIEPSQPQDQSPFSWPPFEPEQPQAAPPAPAVPEHQFSFFEPMQARLESADGTLADSWGAEQKRPRAATRATAAPTAQAHPGGSVIPQISASPTVQAIVAATILDRPRAARGKPHRRVSV